MPQPELIVDLINSMEDVDTVIHVGSSGEVLQTILERCNVTIYPVEFDRSEEWEMRTDPWRNKLSHTPPDKADMVLLDISEGNLLSEMISSWYPSVKENGLIAGFNYNHKHADVEEVVAASFNLMHVQVAEDTWVVRT